MDSLRVFISSTWLDLVEERRAVERALQGLRSTRFTGMEYFGAHDDSTLATSLTEVDRCAVYVGVFGHRYGSGITELEYRRARERNLPCLIYLKDGWTSPTDSADDGAKRLDRLRHELRARHSVGVFLRADDLATRVVADLHNLLFDRLVVQGIEQLKADYDDRIKRFVAEYVGRAEQPMAFGGRDRELRELDRWLATTRGPPYALLAGPAGRGKSALLVRWGQRLAQEPDLGVVFFPISIRFRTNQASVAFASMTARLAALHGEQVPGAIGTPPEVWRALLSSYLRRPPPKGRRFLLIIDGLDEGADWQAGPDLFPAAPPDGLRVLVSARYLAGDIDAQGWLERLGWDQSYLARSFDLLPLKPTGLVQVLRNMSVPLEALSARADIVAELFRLTEGDPLLVNLYVADLWTRGESVARLRPEDLASIEPGLDGYFHRWMKDQRTLWGTQSPLLEPALNAVLSILACALGPLLTAELFALLPADSSIGVWAFEEAIRSMQRFIVGDGESQGYALSHPRLGIYFGDQLRSAGRAQAQEARFVAWGMAYLQDLSAGQRDTSQVPIYVLQFLRQHMERAGNDARAFMVFASNPWIIAWERLDRGSYTGFYSDLNYVRKIATREDEASARRGAAASFIAEEVRCALCASSITNLASDVPVEALVQQVRKGVWSAAQAITHATRISDRVTRMRALLELTAEVEDAYQPLALAAAATEARRLGATSDGRATLFAVIDALTHQTISMARTARLLTAACNVARQLPLPDSQQMTARIADVAERRFEPAEHFVAALRAVAPFLSAARAADYRIRAGHVVLEIAGACVRTTRAATADRLALLRETITDDESGSDWQLLHEALSTGSMLLADVAERAPEERAGAAELALGCLPRLHAADVGTAIETLAPFLTARQMHDALRHVTRIASPIERIRALAALAPALDATRSSSLVASLIAASRAKSAPADAESIPALCRVGTLLTRQDRSRWLEVVTRQWPIAAALDLFTALADGRPDPQLFSDLAGHTWSALARLSQFDERLDALTALADWLRTAETSDSFEEWRPRPENRDIAPRLLRLFTRCEPPRPDVRAAATRLAAGLRVRWRAKVDEVRPPPPPATDEAVDRVSDLVKATLSAEPAIALDAALQRFAALAPSVPFDLLWQGVAEVIADLPNVDSEALVHALTTISKAPLFPPTSEGLQAIRVRAQAIYSRRQGPFDELWAKHRFPDLIRQELLIASLLRGGRDASEVAPRLTRAGLLARPSHELLDLVLSRLSEGHGGDYTTLALTRIAPHVRASFLHRWLTIAGSLPRAERQHMLRVLTEARSVDVETHWRRVLEAVNEMGSHRDRATWLVDLVDMGAPVGSHIVDVARGVEGDQERLLALFAALSAIGRAERKPVLVEALRLARRLPDVATIGRALIQMAIDVGLADSVVLSEAIETGASLSDRRQRAEAFADLAAVLPADELAAASKTFRTLGDLAYRVRTMMALAGAIKDPAQSRLAVDQTLMSICSRRPDSARGRALIALSPMLPVTRRWTVISEGLRDARRSADGFERTELLGALQSSLPDAPAAVMRQALSWSRAQEPDLLRSRTVLKLVPFLPSWLTLPAFSLIAACYDDELIEAAAPHLDEATLARARDRAPYLAAATKGLLLRVSQVEPRARASLLDTAPWMGRPTDDVVAQLDAANSDVQRATAIQVLCLAGQVDDELKKRVVEAANQIGEPSLRASAARYLAVLADEPAWTLARQAAGGIERAGERCVVMAHVAARRNGPARFELLEQALAATRAEAAPPTRVLAAAELAVRAPEVFTAALDLVWSASEGSLCARALRAIIPRLDDARAAIAVRTLDRLGSSTDRALVLSVIAPTLGAVATRAALEMTSRLDSAVARGRALSSLAPRLEDESREPALTILDDIGTDFAWLDTLVALSSRWPTIFDHQRAQSACAILASIDDDDAVASWLGRMIPRWPPSALADFIEATRRVAAVNLRAELLSSLASTRPEMASDLLLGATREIEDVVQGHIALAHVMSARRPEADAEVITALRTVRSSGGNRRYLDTLVAVSARRSAVSRVVLDALLEELRRDSSFAVPALSAVAPLLSADQALRVLEAFCRTGAGLRDLDGADLLFDLARRLDPADRPFLLEQIPRLFDEATGSALLCGLAPLSDDDRSSAVMLRLALSMRSDAFRVQTLTAALVCFRPEQQRVAIGSLSDTPHEIERLRRLRCALPHLAPDAVPALLEESRRFRNPAYEKVLVELAEAGFAGEGASGAPLVTDPDIATCNLALRALLRDSLVDAPPCDASREVTSPPRAGTMRVTTLLSRMRRTEHEGDRFDEVMRSLPWLSAEGMTHLLGQLPQYLTEEHQAAVLAQLRTPLPLPLQIAAVEAASGLGDVECQRRAWSSVLSRVGPEIHPKLHDLWSSMLRVDTRRAHLLDRLRAYVPFVATRGGDAGLAETIRAIADVGAIWP